MKKYDEKKKDGKNAGYRCALFEDLDMPIWKVHLFWTTSANFADGTNDSYQWQYEYTALILNSKYITHSTTLKTTLWPLHIMLAGTSS